MRGNCKDCEYWGSGHADGMGTCRRRAPTPMGFSVQYNAPVESAYWPQTNRDDWCGEYRPLLESVTVSVTHGFGRESCD